ncbi:MAG: mechanosensitive ion channel family protein [Prevotellaceae bacterium]|jgi:small-conductance mechanosensitive channel|nr:mechanosensitive ion channel family protein [Prevotellaceae bacterium]
MKRLLFLLAATLLQLLPSASINTYASYAPGAAAVDSAPVAPFGDTLFTLYGSIGAVTAQKRAELIAENIILLKDDLLFKPDSLAVASTGKEAYVVYRDKIIIGVTERQGAAAGKPLQELAQEYRNAIAAAVVAKQAENTWFAILKQLLLAIFVVAAAYIAIKHLNRLYRKMVTVVGRHKIKPIRLLKYIMDTNKQAAMGLTALKILRYFLIVVVIYICALVLFRIFPATRWLSDTLIGYLTTPLKSMLMAVWNYLPNIFDIAIIIFLFSLVNKALRIVSNKVAGGALSIKGFQPDWATPTYRIIKVIVIIFALILIFPHLPKSDSEIFKGISVFMGVLISLGSTSIISNIVSGLVITYMNPFKEGDRIKMGEHVGDVIEKTALVTRLKTPKNEIITIPNSNIMTAQTVNYSKSAKEYGLILHAQLTMGYETPWRKVHELLMEAGAKTPHVLQEPKPFVLQTALDDFYVQYQINVYTAEACRMLEIYSRLYANIQDVFHREGIELASPSIASVRDGSAVCMPKENIRPGREHTPPFRVSVEK